MSSKLMTVNLGYEKSNKEKHYVDVAYKYKDIARSIGARYDGDKKCWYTYNDIDEFETKFKNEKLKADMKDIKNISKSSIIQQYKDELQRMQNNYDKELNQIKEELKKLKEKT